MREKQLIQIQVRIRTAHLQSLENETFIAGITYIETYRSYIININDFMQIFQVKNRKKSKEATIGKRRDIPFF